MNHKHNPMLLFVICNSITTPSSPYKQTEPDDELDSRLCNVIVHAWYEGHVDAEDQRSPASIHESMQLRETPESEFPSPPFPLPEEVHAIVKEVMEKFDSSMIDAAVAYGAALGWKAGTASAKSCACAYRGRDPEVARHTREYGHLEIFMRDGGASDRALKKMKRSGSYGKGKR